MSTVSDKWSTSLQYINGYWGSLIRHNPSDVKTLIGVPHPYMVPTNESVGGFTFNEQYYWDSYFMFLGLLGTEYEHFILGMTKNLAHLFQRWGVIPNANRAYFTSRSQPPFFTRMIWLCYEILKRKQDPGADDFLREMMLVAEEEHEQVWLGTQMPHIRLVHQGLSRYWDINAGSNHIVCESGWDLTTRCDFSRTWPTCLPVCLNSILYFREIDMSRAFASLGSHEASRRWSTAAAKRCQTMTELMWDPEQEIFLDYDFKKEARNPEPSLACFYPLWAGLATPQQAKVTVNRWLPQFERAGGLATTLEEAVECNWAYPIGWAPLQWLVVQGLDRYGFHDHANRIREKWCALVAAVLKDTGLMWEKYDVASISAKTESGLYGQLPGFGWTCAIFKNFADVLSSGRVSSDPFFHLPESAELFSREAASS
jgi:alpha,alpha-trehalase